jgi:hypothetical protein
MKIYDRWVYKEAKLCKVCERPFTIRKKRKNNFDEIFYCSDKCRKNKNK